MSIVGIYVRNKDEANIIEFMEHYYSLGFEYIIMLDDHSKVHPSCVIGDKFAEKYKIIQVEKTIIDNYKTSTDYLYDNAIFSTYILPELKKHMDYCLYIDMDEYLVLNKFKNINEVIEFYQPFDQFKINWLFFGNNGIKKCEDLSKLKPLFTKSAKKMNIMVKSLVKVNSIISNTDSHSFFINGINKNLLNKITDVSSFEVEISNALFKDVPLYIAHYITQDTYSFVKRRFGRYIFQYADHVKSIEHTKHDVIEREKLVNYINDNMNDIVDYVHGDQSDINIFLDVYREYITWIKSFFDSHNSKDKDNYNLSTNTFEHSIDNFNISTNTFDIPSDDSFLLLDKFDWIFYLDTYPDLRENGILTKERALIHWEYHGKREGRICRKMNNIGISLGDNCNPAMFGVKNNYRSTKQDGYNTCVFDLMVSNYTGVVKCILEDFNNFTDVNYLKFIENDDVNKNIIINTYYHFCFNHETPGHADLYLTENWPEGTNHFINNNYAHFIERYNKRINNFKKYLEDDANFISFIIEFKHQENPQNDCKDLRDALSLKYPNLQYKIIVI